MCHPLFRQSVPCSRVVFASTPSIPYSPSTSSPCYSRPTPGFLQESNSTVISMMFSHYSTLYSLNLPENPVTPSKENIKHWYDSRNSTRLCDPTGTLRKSWCLTSRHFQFSLFIEAFPALGLILVLFLSLSFVHSFFSAKAPFLLLRCVKNPSFPTFIARFSILVVLLFNSCYMEGKGYPLYRH